MPNCTSDGRILQSTLVGPVKAMSCPNVLQFFGHRTFVEYNCMAKLDPACQWETNDSTAVRILCPYLGRKGGFLRIECVFQSKKLVAKLLRVLMP